MDLSELPVFPYEDITPTNNPCFIASYSDGTTIKGLSLGNVLWGALNRQGTNRSFRRNIYRGANLGSVVTDEQWAAIKDGTFNNMFIGDYWQIGNRMWFICDFDYWLGVAVGIGDEPVTVKDHHIVIMPYYAITNDKIVVDGSNLSTGYEHCKIRTETIPNIITPIVNAAFGADHILGVPRFFSNSANATGVNGGVWKKSFINLPSAGMIFGDLVSNAWLYVNRSDLTRLAMFDLNPTFAWAPNKEYWLSDIHNMDTGLISGYMNNMEGTYHINNQAGVRPVFAIYAP